MMKRKRRCPGCKRFLSNHSFGPASKHCNGPVAPVEADESDEVVDVPCADTTVEKTNDDSLPLASGLSPIEAQRDHNKKLRDELASLQQMEDLKALDQKMRRRCFEPKYSKNELLFPRSPSLRHDLRKDEALQDKVEQQLAQLAVGDDCSSSNSDGDADEESDDARSRKASRRSTGKSLRSGKTVKPTSKVVRPQLWPHSELNLAACSKDVTYDKLTIEEFVAGYATILHSRKLSTAEKIAREEHLIHLMYLAMTYEWHAVLAYHGAVLLEIERGHAAWGDSFHHLDARILQGHFKSPGASVRQSAPQSAPKDSRPVLFCRDYQRGTFSSPIDARNCIDSSQDLIQASGLLDTDLSEQHCLSNNIKLISQESSSCSSLTVDLSSDLQTCDYSSVTCVTHDLVEPCGSVRDTQDSVQDLISPETGDHDLFVPLYSTSPTGDLSRDLLTRNYYAVSYVTRDFIKFCGSARDNRDIIQDVFVLGNVAECDTSSSIALVSNDPAYGIFLHDTVYASGAFNYQVCRLPVPSRLNIPLWRSLLASYDDYIVCDYLEFGWPIGYVRNSLPVTQQRNHQGATLFPEAIDKYLQTERSYGAVLGPFASNPFSSDVVLSPLNSVPKGEFERRIIVDLSWPIGASVNDGIPSKQYLGEDFSLVYPTVDDVAARILALGPGCLLFKRDLKRAYRQFPVDPGDYHLLGYSWQNQMFF
ncbi:hypothetical protein ACROYT_G029497 [Oculina patagonica]